MKIKIISSGSHGNCYFVDSSPPFLLEAGVSLSKVREAIDFRLSEVEACFVSHSHQDHAKYVEKLALFGVKCYMTPETHQEVDISSPFIREVTPMKAFTAGDMEVTAFPVEHDTELPVGFIIEFGDERIFYSGDTAYIRYKNLPKFTRILIECNWSNEIEIDQEKKKRIMRTHLSLEQVREFLKKQDLSETKEILLLHISQENGDPRMFKRAIQEDTGKVVRDEAIL